MGERISLVTNIDVNTEAPMTEGLQKVKYMSVDVYSIRFCIALWELEKSMYHGCNRWLVLVLLFYKSDKDEHIICTLCETYLLTMLVHPSCLHNAGRKHAPELTTLFVHPSCLHLRLICSIVWIGIFVSKDFLHSTPTTQSTILLSIYTYKYYIIAIHLR